MILTVIAAIFIVLVAPLGGRLRGPPVPGRMVLEVMRDCLNLQIEETALPAFREPDKRYGQGD